MWLRVTIDRKLVVHAIEAAMDAHPLQDCPQGAPGLQGMVGACMARGWRQAIRSTWAGWPVAPTCASCCSTWPPLPSRPLPAAFGGGDPDTAPATWANAPAGTLRATG